MVKNTVSSSKWIEHLWMLLTEDITSISMTFCWSADGIMVIIIDFHLVCTEIALADSAPNMLKKLSLDWKLKKKNGSS